MIESYWYRPSNDCTIDDTDGLSEVMLADQEYIQEWYDNGGGDPLPPNVELGGLAIPRTTCSSPPRILEMDLLVDETLDFSDPSATTPDTGLGRQTFLHEFGHWFGFDHDNTGYFSVLGNFGNPNTAEGNGAPTVAGTPSSVLWPNDTNGLNQLYGLTSSLPNLIPSAHTVENGEVELIDSHTENVCPCDTVHPEIYIGNTGKSNSGVFAVRVFLKSISDPVSPSGGITVATQFAYLNAFSETQAGIPFTIPEEALVPGNVAGYDVNVYVDHLGSIDEVSNQDNWTISGIYIFVDGRTGVGGTCPQNPQCN